MLNIDKLDKLYSVDITNVFKLQRNDTGFDVFKGKYKLSEILDGVKNGTIELREFDVDGSTGKLEDFIVARQLNDELKVVIHGYYVLVFGNLEHYITKEPIKVPEGFTDLSPEYTEEAYSRANQVLWLAPETIEKSILNTYRKMLRNLLKYNTTTTADDLLNL